MYQPYAVPISVKCIVVEDGKVWLRKNERDEWELPGGKLDKGEQPETTAAREALEELGVVVRTNDLVGATLYTISVSADERRGVFVIAYSCDLIERTGDVEHIGEAGRAEFSAFAPEHIAALPMPQFYKDWIAKSLMKDRL
jgi:8-oxo-dGTP pyrophosphatase MutT (NUDIX family)